MLVNYADPHHHILSDALQRVHIFAYRKKSLLITFSFFVCAGPYKVNGVPIRRVAQAYVIATETKLDLSNFKLPERLTDDFFKREPKKKKRTEDMFEDTQEVMQLSRVIKH